MHDINCIIINLGELLGEVEDTGTISLESSPETTDDEQEDLDTDEQVAEAMKLYTTQSVGIEASSHDVKESQSVDKFVSEGYGCKKFKGKPCSTQFAKEYIEMYRNSCLGQLSTLTSTGKIAVQSRHPETEREKAYTSVYHQGKCIRLRSFRFLHAVGKMRVNNYTQSLKHNGLQPRIHGNVRRLPKHTLTIESVQYVVKFLLMYTEQHGLLLPGRVPGYCRSDIKLLPSSVSKRTIWKTYKTATEATNSVCKVAYTTFCRLWRTLLPSIVLMKPMSDLCWKCQQNSSAILRAANSSDVEKSDTLKAAQDHLLLVQLERSHYKTYLQRECSKTL